MMYISNRQLVCGLAAISSSIYLHKNQDLNQRMSGIRVHLYRANKAFDARSLLERRVDHLFEVLKKDHHERKDLFNHVNRLREIAKEAESKEILEHILRKTNKFLDELREGTLLESFVCEIIPAVKIESRSYSEFRKKELLNISSLFLLANDCIYKSSDKHLVAESKINFANLPFEGGREALPHLFMDEKDQLEYLCEALQQKENKLVDEIVRLLNRELCFFLEKDLFRLEKLLTPERELCDFSLRGGLSDDNALKLRLALSHRAMKGDGFRQRVIDSLLSIRQQYLEGFFVQNLVKDLKRMTKCKVLFQEQQGLSREEIRIPYWYHATRPDKIFPLLKEAQIKVMFRGADVGFKGAWVSSRVEDHFFGSSVLALSSKIDRVKEISIGHESQNFRWRGFLSPIPLKEKAVVLLLSVQVEEDKALQKENKKNLHNFLQENHYVGGYKICSVKQLVFLQREITCILGIPNLSSAFWGYNRK